MNATVLFQVNRLIYLSLALNQGKKALVARYQSEMEALVQKYQAEDSFRQLVATGLEAMSLQVVMWDDMGLHLSATGPDALFAMTVSDYSRLLGRSDLKAGEILAIHCAVATAFFPMADDLEAPVEDLGVIVTGDVIEILRRFARAESALDDADPFFHPGMRTVAQRLRDLPEENPDSRRSSGGHAWKELIDLVMKHLVETGYLLQFDDLGEDVEYRPTPVYQSALRQGMLHTWEAFQKLVKTCVSGEEEHVPAQ